MAGFASISNAVSLRSRFPDWGAPMRTRIDGQLVEQVGAYHLRYCCEDCCHFDDHAAACSLGYPDEPHRLRVLLPEQELLFCKEFDLV